MLSTLQGVTVLLNFSIESVVFLFALAASPYNVSYATKSFLKIVLLWIVTAYHLEIDIYVFTKKTLLCYFLR